MTTTLKELQEYLDILLQSNVVADYCPNGIQVEGKQAINKLATAVSASLDTIQEAIKWGAQALLVHHGLFWQGDNYVVTGPKREKLRLLLENNVSLLAYHLPLDMHQQYGNNWKAALDMGWKDLQPFGMHRGMPIGVKGKIGSKTRDAFKKQLEAYYKHEAFCAFGGKEKIETAALISGGSYKSISEAIADGLDCFITGNFDEPVWNQAHEGKINFFALGHTATERIGPQALGLHLQDTFKFKHKFIDTLNPF